MTQFDTTWLDAGSANPTLNRNHLHPLKVRWPSVGDQIAIAEVLGALDDKIAANTKLATTASDLAGLVYDGSASKFDTRPMSEVLSPVLGGRRHVLEQTSGAAIGSGRQRKTLLVPNLESCFPRTKKSQRLPRRHQSEAFACGKRDTYGAGDGRSRGQAGRPCIF